MGGFGNEREGLLFAIINIFREGQRGDTFRTTWITEELIRREHWGTNVPPTPYRTVNSYCSQHPEIFHRVDPDDYVLDDAYFLD